MRIVSFLSSSLRRIGIAGAALLAVSPAVLRAQNSPSAADGFDPNVSGIVYVTAIQPDGKILLAGNFSTVKPNGTVGLFRNNIARINADGTLDATFDPNANAPVTAMVLLANGQILIGGNFTTLQPNGAPTTTTRNHLARLNSDGTVDPSFDPNASNSTYNISPTKMSINALAVQLTDGKILVGGDFDTFKPAGAILPTTRNYLARLNSDGTPDTSFNPNPNGVVLSLALAAADPSTKKQQIYVGGGFTTMQPNGATAATACNYLGRLNSDGTVDSAFAPNPSSSVTTIVIQPDTKILIAGSFAQFQPSVQPNGASSVTNINYFTRLNSDGSLDAGFINTNVNSRIMAIALQHDGKILIGGLFSSIQPGDAFSTSTHPFCARLNSDGSLDDAFNPNPNYSVDAFAVQDDGKIVIGGYFTQLKPNGTFTATNRNHLARLNPDGSLDTNLDPNAANRIQTMAVQADGKILFGGLSFTSVGGQTRNGIVRLNADGTLDAPFNPDVNNYVTAIALLPADPTTHKQKIIIGGRFTSVGGSTQNYIAQLNDDGTLDKNFTPVTNSIVNTVAIETLSGKTYIILGGNFTQFLNSDSTATARNNAARLNADGTLDTTFDPTPDAAVNALVVQPDGKILIGGNFSNLYPNGAVVPTAQGSIARLNTDGTVDLAFSAHANGPVIALALQADGKVVLGGQFTQVFGVGSTAIAERHGIARFNSDGSVDAIFDPSTNGQVVTVAVQTDQKILLGGLFTTLQPNGATNWTQRNYFARVNTDGKLDDAFDPNVDGQVRAVIARSDSGNVGKILLAGGFATLQALQPDGITRITSTVSLPIVQLNANGTVDTGFKVSAGGSDGSQVNALAVQPDGRIIAGGTFTTLAGSPSPRLARFHTDNSEDDFFTPSPDGAVNAVAVLSDNGGIASQIPGFSWLNPSGSFVTGFTPNSVVQFQGHMNAIAVEPLSGGQISAGKFGSGQILLGGEFTNQATGGNLVRLNADGGLDLTFNPSPDGAIYAILVRTDGANAGKIIVAGAFGNIAGAVRNHIAQLNPDGSIDATFDPNADNLVNVLLQQPDGKILIGGAFNNLTPNAAAVATARNFVARLNTDGTVDTAFDPHPDNNVSSMALQADGKIVIGGAFSNFSPNGATTTTKRISIARLNPADGSLDPGFDPNGAGNVLSIVVQPADQKILVAGNFTTMGGWQRNGIARLQTNGNLDEPFNPNANGQVNQLVLQPGDNWILVAGAFTAVGGVTRNGLARLKADGSVDLNYDPSPNNQVNVLSLQTDGTVMAGGWFSAFRSNGTLVVGGAFTHIGGISASYLAMLRDDGNVDSTFQPGSDGAVNALLLQADQKFVVGGDFTHIAGVARNRLARFLSNTDGTYTLDPTFNAPAPLSAVTALTLQGDGKIIVGAPFSSGATANASLARLNADGSLDPTFQPGLLGGITALAVQPDGRVLAADAALTPGVSSQPGRVVRLNGNGSRDASFNAYANGKIATLALQTDGRIVIGGVFTTVDGVARNRLARLNADGSLDITFDPNADNSVYALALQPDGKVLVGGAFSLVSGQGRYLLARIAATPPSAQYPALTTQSLNPSSDHTSVIWTRTGSGPELSGAVFDQSTDAGVTWTRLGIASRMSGTSNWQLGGLSLPSSVFYVRARGIVLTSQYGSANMIELIWQFMPSTTSGSGYVGIAADLNGGTTSNQTTLNVAFGNTLSASSVSGAGTTAQQSGGGTAVGRLISLSARATVSGGYPLITGFVISGSGAKSVLVRAVGPGLSGYGVAAPLAAPRMQIYSATSGLDLLDVNTGWGGSSNLIAAFSRLGAFPLPASSADAAALVTLSPGAYTVTVPDGQGSGTVLAEVYDADDSTSSGTTSFTGLSARAQVITGDPLIAGLAISGNTSRRVLLRGWGPALAKNGVSGVLGDPVLTVYDNQERLLAQNDNWQTQTAVNSTQTIGSTADVVAACISMFDSGSKDSALIITLAPGSYTIEISGANHGAGAALVEAYDLGP